MAETYAERLGDRGAVRAASGANLLLGAWLIVSPAVFYTTDVSFWNNIVVGVAVFLLAGLRVLVPRMGTKILSWLNVLLGIWLVFSPFLLDYGMRSVAWNDIIVGILLVGLAWWSASRPRAEEVIVERRR